jgi:hypothetical protein
MSNEEEIVNVKHDGKGGVKILASPKKDERHAYTPDQVDHLADCLTEAAQEARNYLVSVAHQDMVNAPNPHAAQEKADETEAPHRPAYAQDAVRSDASTATAPTPSPLRASGEKPKRVRSQASKDAAAKKAREKRAAAKKAAK